jgi:hypothetical protein
MAKICQHKNVAYFIIIVAVAMFLLYGFVEGTLASHVFAKHPEDNPFAYIGMEQYRYFVTVWFIFMPLILLAFIGIYVLTTKDLDSVKPLILLVIGLMCIAVIQDWAVFAFSKNVNAEYSIFSTKLGLPFITLGQWQIPILWIVLPIVGVVFIYYALKECY